MIIEVLSGKDDVLSRIFWKQTLRSRSVCIKLFGEHAKEHL